MERKGSISESKDGFEPLSVKTYTHYIRNGQKFTNNQLRDINLLSPEERLEILATYNEMIAYYVSLFDE
jgi:hypothetical protein